MIDDGYVGNHRRLDCQKYGQYCNNGKLKSSAELLAMRRPPRPEPPKAKGAPPQGSIYTQLSVILNSEFQNAQLGTKAQENYTGWGGSGDGDMPFIYDLVDAITGVSSDFSNSSAELYPIGIRIDWHGNESGVSIDNIQVSNYSPTNVYLDGIHLRTDPLGANDIIVQGPADGVGINGDQPGVINMSVNTTLPSQDTVMTVQITTYGGFPPHPYVRIAFPAGAFPPGGCSVLNP
jgi:hypothetical protein